MEIEATKTVKINAKILKICLKVVDQFVATLYDQDGEAIKSYEGYVPSLMPGQHYGDYVMLDIDIDTGQITNWKKLSPEIVQEFVEASE